MMEEAICHLTGFGVAADPKRYLSILAECYSLGHEPAKHALPAVHDALRIPLPEHLQSQLHPAMVAESVSHAAGPDPIYFQRECPTSEAEGIIHQSNHAPYETDHSNINVADENGDTLLLRACRSGDARMVHLLLASNANAGITNSFGESPLHWVGTMDPCDMLPVASNLVARGADPNWVAKANSGITAKTGLPLLEGTALHRAVSFGNKDAVRALLHIRSNPEVSGGPIFVYKGKSRRSDPIQYACMSHQIEILELMLDAAPLYPINASETSEIGLLFLAIQCLDQRHRMVQHGTEYYFRMHQTIDLLLHRGSTNVVSADGLTALQFGGHQWPSRCFGPYVDVGHICERYQRASMWAASAALSHRSRGCDQTRVVD
jgi:hypothetical protein